MAHVYNWNGDLVEVNWVFCNRCDCEFVEEVHEGKCPACGKLDDYRLKEEDE